MTKKMIMNMAEKLSAKVELYNSYDPDFHREKAQRLKELDLFVQGVRCFDPENIRITFEDNEHSFGFRKITGACISVCVSGKYRILDVKYYENTTKYNWR